MSGPRSIAGTQEVLRQAQRALESAANHERTKRRAGLYRLHARECEEEIRRLDRATIFVRELPKEDHL